MAFTIAPTKRKHPRAPLETKADLVRGGERLQADLKQISEGGLCVVCEKELKGDLSVSFEIPGVGRQQLHSEVRWVTRPGESKRSGNRFALGCRFIRPEPKQQAEIARYVGKVKQSYTQLQFQLALGKPLVQLVPLLHEVGLSHFRDRDQLKMHVAEVVAQLQPR